MSEHDYRIHIEPLSEEDGGGFVAFVPDLPGCMSDGETEQEALSNVLEAISDWLDCAKSMKRKIPEPTRELMHA